MLLPRNRTMLLRRWLIVFVLLLSTRNTCGTHASSNGDVVLTSVPSAAANAAASAAAAAASATAASKSALDKTFSRIAAGKLIQSLGQQNVHTTYRTPAAHVHRKLLEGRFGRAKECVRPQTGSLSYAIRVGLAGGIAGAAGTLALFPVDSAKTLRQSSPGQYKNVRHALSKLIFEDGKWHIGRAYCGVIPAALGAVPSSALYFGAYECMKPVVRGSGLADANKTSGRLLIHSLSAMSGNVLSRCVRGIREKSQCSRTEWLNLMLGCLLDCL